MTTSRKLALVTGARGGIGTQICMLLVEKQYRLLLLDRSDSSELTAALQARAPESVAGTLRVDLGDRDDIARVCASIVAQWPSLDLLCNNAGVLPDTLTMSKYGNELDFEINALAPLQMIDGLRRALAAAENAIVVNTSAGLASGVKTLDIEDLRHPASFQKLFGPYAKSKQALNVLTSALAREYAADGIAIRAADPGPNHTRLTAGSGTPLWMRLFASFLPGPNVGARRIVDAALSEKFRAHSGAFVSGGRVHALPEALSDPAFQDRFLHDCRALVARA